MCANDYAELPSLTVSEEISVHIAVGAAAIGAIWARSRIARPQGSSGSPRCDRLAANGRAETLVEPVTRLIVGVDLPSDDRCVVRSVAGEGLHQRFTNSVV